MEEVAVIKDIAAELLGAAWCGKAQQVAPLTWRRDPLVIPYNAQVSALIEVLLEFKDRIGTVDRFQGPGLPVVIYSMTSSSPDFVPREIKRLCIATSKPLARGGLNRVARDFGHTASIRIAMQDRKCCEILETLTQSARHPSSSIQAKPVPRRCDATSS